MTENGPLESLIPSIPKAFGPGRINLLDRLRQFPEYEQTRDERSSEIDRWKAEVLKRAGRNAPWIPLVAAAHGTANKLIIDAPRLRELMVPCVSSVDHVCAISPESVQECQEIFEIPQECIAIEGYGYEPEFFNYKAVDRFRVLKPSKLMPGAAVISLSQ